MKSIIKSLLLSRILDGPFRGMAYLRDTTGSGLLPKIFGTYERELHSIIDSWINTATPGVIDVGAAEGYYAVGLLFRQPTLTVTAFEMDATGRERLSQLGELNGVRNRLTILGECTPTGLHDTLSSLPGARLLMDVEGAEKILLDPARCPALARTEILVELHDWTDSSLGATLRTRFDRTHTIVEIPAQVRCSDDVRIGWVRFLTRLHGRIERRLLDERPPGMRWFHLSPNVR